MGCILSARKLADTRTNEGNFKPFLFPLGHVIVVYMTKLLEHAVAQVITLPETDQDSIACMILEMIEPDDYFFVNVGQGDRSVRTWDDNVKYGYVGAGQGAWYRDGLQRL